MIVLGCYLCAQHHVYILARALTEKQRAQGKGRERETKRYKQNKNAERAIVEMIHLEAKAQSNVYSNLKKMCERCARCERDCLVS